MSTMPLKPGDPGYMGSIPQIAQAFSNDPRTKLSQSMLAQGTSSAPVAQGGWAVTDGLARAAQAIAGALVNKNNEKKYAKREGDYTAEMAKVAEALAPQQQQTPMPAPTVQPPMPPAPAQAVQMPPQGMDPGMMAPSAVPAAPAPQMAPQTPPRPQIDPKMLFQRGIVPIEGGTDPKTGAFRTSPKGAFGPSQLMPGTAPEAARLAGLPYSERRARTDPEYNLALGEAYYAKQLETFKDPMLAAAAYNAGPGNVRRAMRKVRRNGGEIAMYLPTETQGYIQKFAAAVGGGADPAEAAVSPVAPVQMENLPQGLEAPGERPTAPTRPGEVKSASLDVARMLLSSGNPDLMTIGQTYLDKGTTEKFDAGKLASEQEFTQGQTGYQADLNDNNAARSDFRQQQANDRRDAFSRNFSREQTNSSQTFEAGQNASDRAFRRSERVASQGYETVEAEKQRTFQAGQLERTIEGKRLNATEKADAKRSEFFRTPTGAKFYEKATSAIAKNDDALEKLARFATLNEEQSTGGVVRATMPGFIQGAVNSKISEMNTIANEFTLDKLGGSLGVAISDGDRKFVSEASLSVGAGKKANDAKIAAWRKAITRTNDFETSRVNAYAEGRETQFINEWNMYKNKVPISAAGGYVPFSQWRNQNVKRYDAQGRLVN